MNLDCVQGGRCIHWAFTLIVHFAILDAIIQASLSPSEEAVIAIFG